MEVEIRASGGLGVRYGGLIDTKDLPKSIAEDFHEFFSHSKLEQMAQKSPGVLPVNDEQIYEVKVFRSPDQTDSFELRESQMSEEASDLVREILREIVARARKK